VIEQKKKGTIQKQRSETNLYVGFERKQNGYTGVLERRYRDALQSEERMRLFSQGVWALREVNWTDQAPIFRIYTENRRDEAEIALFKCCF
jgi:hypothetical protein